MSSQHSQHDEEPLVETQEVKQTQQATQSQYGREIDENVWASFCSLVKEVKQIDLLKPQLTYHVGRNTSQNDIVFPGFKISNKHAEITWDGRETKDSIITLKDLSSNGTFINGHKLGKGVSCILNDGAEVAFGSLSSAVKPAEDYRFIFRHTASGTQPEEGFYSLYDTHDQLGSGTFAKVVRCLERSSGTLWAAKIFNNHLTMGGSESAGSGTSNDRMVSREIAILETLQHPHVCFLKETFVTSEGKLILVLELVEGGDLLECILQNSGVSEDAAQHITYQLCLALSYVHSLGIAHRDLKPENILLTKTDPPNVKVADFGLAKALDSQTMLKTMCGTPAYLAPEIVMQTKNQGYDFLVDSWSVGVILFSMLTASSPFIEDETQQDLRMRICTRKIDWNLLKRRTSNPMIIDFIRKLLDADPETRMTLTGALDHDWLLDYVTKHNRNAEEDRNQGKRREPRSEASESTPASSSQNQNEEPQAASTFFSRGFQNLAINDGNQSAAAADGAGGSSDPAPANGAVDGDSQMEDATPPPPSSQGRKLQAQNSRVLRRRKDVLEEVKAGETSIPRPSPELLSQFDENRKREADQAQAGTSNPTNFAEKRRGKRAHDDLSAVPEGAAVNGTGNSGGDVAEDVAMGEDGLAVQPTPSKRRRNTPASPSDNTRGKKGKKATGPSVPVRRSTRNKGTAA
ncbi:kinase-like domain-containing protein [Lentinula raphanica]|nr:kinase-like domain-containing protein [Lentinula raphanica]